MFSFYRLVEILDEIEIKTYKKEVNPETGETEDRRISGGTEVRRIRDKTGKRISTAVILSRPMPVGFLASMWSKHGVPTTKKGTSTFVSNIDVKEPHRRKGLGTRLMRHAAKVGQRVGDKYLKYDDRSYFRDAWHRFAGTRKRSFDTITTPIRGALKRTEPRKRD